MFEEYDSSKIYVSHLLTDEDMAELIETEKIGVETIEFSISENLDRLSEKICAYRQRLKNMGCNHLTVHGPFLDLNPAAYDSLIREVTMKRFAQSYEAALELGAEKIVYHSGMDPHIYFLEGWAERVSDFFREFLENRTELPVVMENVLDPQWKPFLEVKKLITAKNFHLCLDLGHAHCYSENTVEEWAMQMADQIAHVHIHDNSGNRDAHMALGKGTIPYLPILQRLSLREGRTWTIECSSKEEVLQTIQILKQSAKID